MPSAPVAAPDLSGRPLRLTVERQMAASPASLYRAWTTGWDVWFAAPGTVLMRAEVDAPLFFETRFEDRRHPHYERFLVLEPDRRVELTWVTGADGTEGAETVVTLGLEPAETGTGLRLTHAGFLGEPARDRHREAWPQVLDHLDRVLLEGSAPDSR